MKKVLITLFLGLILCNKTFAESYYFNECQLNEKVYADYLIDFEKNIIKVSLKTTEGSYQEFSDKIKSVSKNQIISEIIQSGAGKDYYFQYYLDADSRSVIKLKYKKKNNMFTLEGPKKQSYCANVKTDWNKIKNQDSEKKEQLEFEEEKKKKEAEVKKLRQKELTQKKREKKGDKHIISINDEKWIALSKANIAEAEHLKNDFNKRAMKLCSPTGNFDILKQNIEVIAMDETPAIGLEPVVKFGIKGVVECK